MRRFFATLIRRFWPWLLVVVVLGVAAAIAWPQAWAWYHLNAGRDAVQHFHADDGRSHLDACLATWPNCVEAQLLDARACRLAGDFKAAEDHLREAQRLQNPPSDDALREWAMFHVAAGDLDGEAADYLRNDILKNPDPEHAAPEREALVEGCLHTYRVLDALAILKEWVSGRPDDVEKWQDVRPDEIEALSLRGDLYWQMGARNNAADDYQRVVELDPQRRQARERLAVGLISKGRYDEALKHLAVVRQWKPDDPAVETSAARCYEGLNRTNEAQRVLDGVLANHPEYGPALLERGRMLVQAEHPGDAVEWLQRAVRAMPRDYGANFALADALEKAGKTEEAKEQRDRADEMKKRDDRFTELTTRQMNVRPLDPNLHYEIGRLYLDRGNKAAAQAWMQSALRLDPHYQPALDALARIESNTEP
ncbi:MAG TPA: tetratricopeptide repeat protein [Gemmataceae bacterium]|nr:tetratricopeptide repeat protein [Gemmataceae bacterium]